MASSCMIALSNPMPGREVEFDAWYSDTHIPQLCDVPGVVDAIRYEAVSTDGSEPAHRYATIYEIEGDAAAVLAEISERAGTGRIELDDSIDPTTMAMTLWTRMEDRG